MNTPDDSLAHLKRILNLVCLRRPRAGAALLLAVVAPLLGPGRAGAVATITSEPQNTTVYEGGTASFTVAATVRPAFPPVAYQWYRAGAGAIADATAPTLWLSNVTASLAGGYYAVAGNIAGVATSQVAVLSVVITLDIRLDPAHPHADAEAQVKARGGVLLDSSAYFNRITFQIESARAPEVVQLAFVVAWQPHPTPVELLDGSRASIGIPLIQAPPWSATANPYNLTGNGVKAGVWDGGQPGTPNISAIGILSPLNVAAHLDLAGRWIPEEMSPSYWFNQLHPTHVSSIMAGDGGQSASQGGTPLQWAGMAPKAEIHTWDFGGAPETEMLLGRLAGKIDFSQNSWAYIGSSQCPLIYGSYMLQCGDADKLVRQERLPIFVAAGNYQSAILGGYGTVTPLGTAKNVVAVGAVDKLDNMAGFSSWGPTLDGRLKPDVVAVGVGVKADDSAGNAYTALSGTSMACPAVSGLSALLIEKYRQLNSADPDPALLKAILCNTASDLGNTGPDFQFGYGKVNALEAVQAIQCVHYLTQTNGLNKGGVHTYSLTVPQSCTNLRVMLAYSDMEFVNWSCNVPTLINDLDLELVDPSSTVHLPLTLNPLLPSSPAVPMVNRRDPVEQVSVPFPSPGVWQIVVKGYNVPAGPQGYALTWRDSCGCAAVAPCAPVPANLVAWWPLGDPAGSPAVAEILNGIPTVTVPGPLSAGGPLAVPGKVNGAIYVYGPALYAQASLTPLLDLGASDFSIDCWAKPIQCGQNYRHPIVDKLDPANPLSGYALLLHNNLVRLLLGIPGLGGQVFTCPTPLALGSWNFIAVSVQRNVGVMFTVNGVITTVATPLPAPNPDNASPLWIGGSRLAYTNGYCEIGIDELEIFNRALPAAEFMTIFAADSAGKCPPQLCGTKFEDMNGNGIQDTGEAGLPGWTIQIYDALNNVVGTAVTDANGRYCFTNIPPGVFTVAEVQQPGWTQTKPAAGPYIVTNGVPQTGGFDFGNLYTNCHLTPWLTNFVVQSGMSNGLPLPAGAPDPNFVLACAPPQFTGVPSVILPTGIPGVWMPNGPNSQWVGPLPSGYGPDGVYCYNFRFFLPCTNHVALFGQFTSDNGCGLWLNGNLTPAFSPAYAAWTPFNLTSGFVPGWNWLTLMVTNIGGPTGFRIEMTNTFRCCCQAQSSCMSVQCPTNITVPVGPGGTTVVTYPFSPTSLCGTVVWSQCQPPSGSAFPVGVTPVQCFAWDASGDVTCCDFTVTVTDCQLSPWTDNFTLHSGRSAGTLLPGGALETNLVMSCAPGGVTAVPTVVLGGSIPAGWMLNGPDSEWIGPNATATGAPGLYCYTHRFYVPCTNAVQLTGHWTMDNNGAIWLNGAPSGASVTVFAPFPNWHPVNITSGFVPGWNSLTFYVTNTSGPTGLRYELTNSVRCCCGPQSCIKLTCPTNITAQTCLSSMAVTYSVGLSTGCPTAPSYVCSPASGSLFPLGTTPVQCVAWDSLGNVTCCSFTVTVLPLQAPPVINCPTGLVATCVCKTNGWVSFNVPGYDACGMTLPVVCQIAPSGPVITSPHLFPPGTTLVQCTVTDPSGASASCSFPVTVIPDTTPPSVFCPGNIVKVTCAQQELVYFKAFGQDNCSPKVSLVYKLMPSGTVITSPWWFPIGTNWVQCTATDACGNQSTCTFAVIIRSGDLWQTIPAGLADCYTLPTEPAFPGPVLSAAYPGGPWKPFDSMAICSKLGHTFKLRKDCTVRDGLLLMRMKPRPPVWFNICPPSNDRIYLGLPSPSPTAWLWNKQIGAPGGLLTNPWDSKYYFGCNYNFAFVMPSLPLGGFNMIPHMNTFKRLDLMVQDNTIVDYASLRVRYCPCFIPVHGLGASLSSGAIVNGPGGLVILSPDPDTGAAAPFSVRFGLGEADGAALNLDGLEFTGALEWSVASSENEPSLALLLGRSAEALELSPVPNAHVKQIRVRVWSNRVLVAEEMVDGASAQPFCSAPASAPLAQLAVMDRTRFNVRWSESVDLSLGGRLVTGDWLEAALQTDAPAPPVSEMVLSGESVGSIGVQGAFLQAFGRFQPSLDNALCTVVNGQFAASPLIPEDGLPLVLDLGLSPTNEFRVQLAPLFGQFDAAPEGAALAFVTRGLVGGGGTERDLDRLALQLQTSGMWSLTADFSPLGADACRVQLFNNGERVLDTPAHSGAVGSVADASFMIGRRLSPASVIWLHRADPVLVTVDGRSYMANDIRLSPQSPGTQATALTGLRIEATRPEALVVAAVDTGAPVFRLETPESQPDGILLRWSGPGGLLQHAPAATGPWSDQFTPEGEWLVTPPATGPAAGFYRVRGN